MARKMLAPINSNKHFVARTEFLLVASAVGRIDLVVAAVAPATTNTFNVEEGSIVKAIHCELWIIGDGVSDTTSQFTITVEKIPSNAPPATLTNLLNLQAYENKKNILYTTQGTIGSQINGQPVPIIRNWVLIPKGKQRMGLGDSIVLNVISVAEDLQICGMFIYKEYR